MQQDIGLRALYVVQLFPDVTSHVAYRSYERHAKQKIALTRSTDTSKATPLSPAKQKVQSFELLGHGQIIFSRRFPTVERRLRRTYKHVTPLPMDCEFSRLVEEERVLAPQHKEPPPVFGLAQGTIWPVVAKKEGDLCFLAIPACPPHKHGDTARPPMMQGYNHPDAAFSPHELSRAIALCPGIAAAIDLMDNIKGPVAEMGPDYTPAALSQLSSLLKLAMPFGRFLGTKLSDLSTALHAGGRFKTADAYTSQATVPCWKPHIIKDQRKNKMEVTLTEAIKLVCYGHSRPNIAVDDAYIVTGWIDCKCDVVGLPSVRLKLSSASATSDIRMHQCADNPEPDINKEISFEPPLGEFRLASYTLSNPHKIPFLANYDMKVLSADKVSVEISFLLGHDMNTPFQSAFLVIPFFNRGALVQVDGLEYSPSHLDMPLLDTPNSQLVWPLGTMFPKEKCTLKGVLTFDKDVSSNSSRKVKDYFLQGQTCFAKILFSCSGYSLSGLNVTTKDISVRIPNAEMAQTTMQTRVRSKVTGDITIWNSLGQARYTRGPSTQTSFQQAREFFEAQQKVNVRLKAFLDERKERDKLGRAPASAGVRTDEAKHGQTTRCLYAAEEYGDVQPVTHDRSQAVSAHDLFGSPKAASTSDAVVDERPAAADVKSSAASPRVRRDPTPPPSKSKKTVATKSHPSRASRDSKNNVTRDAAKPTGTNATAASRSASVGKRTKSKGRRRRRPRSAQQRARDKSDATGQPQQDTASGAASSSHRASSVGRSSAKGGSRDPPTVDVAPLDAELKGVRSPLSPRLDEVDSMIVSSKETDDEQTRRRAQRQSVSPQRKTTTDQRSRRKRSRRRPRAQRTRSPPTSSTVPASAIAQGHPRAGAGRSRPGRGRQITAADVEEAKVAAERASAQLQREREARKKLLAERRGQTSPRPTSDAATTASTSTATAVPSDSTPPVAASSSSASKSPPASSASGPSSRRARERARRQAEETAQGAADDAVAARNANTSSLVDLYTARRLERLKKAQKDKADSATNSNSNGSSRSNGAGSSVANDASAGADAGKGGSGVPKVESKLQLFAQRLRDQTKLNERKKKKQKEMRTKRARRKK